MKHTNKGLNEELKKGRTEDLKKKKDLKRCR